MDKNNPLFHPDDYPCKTDLRVRFNDIDILGHVNNVVYLSLFDTAKADYLQEAFRGNVNWQRVESVIANINCSFINPAYFGEPLCVYTRCKEIGGKHFVLKQVMINSDTRQIKAICETVMVSYNPDTKTTTPVPTMTRTMFEQYEGRVFPLPERDA